MSGLGWVAGRAGVGENAMAHLGHYHRSMEPSPDPAGLTGATKSKTQFDGREGPCTSVMVLGGALEGEPLVGVPGCCGAYFDAHLACSALA